MAHANTDVLNSYQVNTLLEALLDLVQNGDDIFIQQQERTAQLNEDLLACRMLIEQQQKQIEMLIKRVDSLEVPDML